jgi:hypothetical protein
MGDAGQRKPSIEGISRPMGLGNSVKRREEPFGISEGSVEKYRMRGAGECFFS